MGTTSDLEALKAAIIAGDIVAATIAADLLERGADPRTLLDDALLPGMDRVSWRMHTGEAMLPEVLLSAAVMQSCIDLLAPHLISSGGDGRPATAVIGTVQGDLHDIGKNLVAVMLRAAGFNVINLGVNVTPAQFVAVVQEHEPVILGLSATLAATMRRIPETIDALENAGLRDRVKVICGGSPVSEAFCEEAGADAYGPNAPVSVERCKVLAGAEWLGNH
jgi:5-methyltetrahydrofolate--homocysteine methyltransferase